MTAASGLGTAIAKEFVTFGIAANVKWENVINILMRMKKSVAGVLSIAFRKDFVTPKRSVAVGRRDAT